MCQLCTALRDGSPGASSRPPLASIPGGLEEESCDCGAFATAEVSTVAPLWTHAPAAVPAAAPAPEAAEALAELTQATLAEATLLDRRHPAAAAEDDRKRQRTQLTAAEKEGEIMRWAAERQQALSRTVRGVMLYGRALRVLARLEGVDEEEIEAVVGQKFEYVVSCQIYNQLRASNEPLARWKAQCIDALRHEFAQNLRVAFVDRTRDAGSKADEYASVLLGVDPISGEEQVLFKVKLPGDPIIGEGKPENQNHAIIFAHGEYLQTLDMNQDN